LEFILAKSGLRALYRQPDEADNEPIANLDELVSAAAEYHAEQPESTIVEWLEHTALLGDIDAVQDGSGAVTLMTLHAAKGLEFDVVYVIGLEEGMLPFRRQGADDSDEEEERRLLFVGITRARKRLTLSHARYRLLRGISERTVRSPFLDELPKEEVEWDRIEVSPPRRVKVNAPRGRLPDDIDQWTVGILVRHPIHGLGKVMSLNRGAKRTHVDVKFQEGTRRSWVLEFAQLARVDFDEIGDVDDLVGV
jgi:DNA helicase-2/ATP-dependent DNA helicase PcrA